MKGRTVITSKDSMPYVMAVERLRDTPYEKEEKTSMILWNFPDAETAQKNAEVFMNIGFEYVQRV